MFEGETSEGYELARGSVTGRIYATPVSPFTQMWQQLYWPLTFDAELNRSNAETSIPYSAVFCLSPSVHYLPGMSWGMTTTNLWRSLQATDGMVCSRCLFGFCVALWYDFDDRTLMDGTLACVHPRV